MTNIKSELEDNKLEKVSGGIANVPFNHNQCPCANFKPYNETSNDKSAYNCLRYVEMKSVGGKMSFPDGVCRAYK